MSTNDGTLMVRCITEITFEQVDTTNEGRNLKLYFDFVNNFDGSDSWVDLTNTCKIVLPKNVYVRDQNNNLVPLGGNTPNKLINWLFRRGDKVTLNYGYYTYDTKGNETRDIPSAPIFRGFLSAVESKQPLTLMCEDNMWILKQVPCKPQVWPAHKTVEDLLKSLFASANEARAAAGLEALPFTVNGLTQTTVGSLIIQNESIAQLLARLRKDYHLEAYFRGDELRIGSQVYIESEAVQHNFIFQQNIISNQLVFKRKDDVQLSAVCTSINTKETGHYNKQGEAKTKKERLSVLVYSDPTTGNFKYVVKEKDKDFPANEQGERRTLFYPNITSAAALAQLGADELQKYYYTGFKGDFTAFGIPYVKQGDNVFLFDRILPDRNGLYKVRAVKYKGGTTGHRQTITIDYKLVTQNGVIQPNFPPAKVTPA